MSSRPSIWLGIGLILIILGVGLLTTVMILRLDAAEIHRDEWNQARAALDQLIADHNATPGTPSVASATTSKDVPSTTEPKVNSVVVNRASASELDALPGIGTVRAQAIVDERNAHGDFRDLDDLHARVSKIPSSVLQDISQYITF